MYMNTHFIEDKQYQLVDQVDERKINWRVFYSALLDHIHLFYYGNGRTCYVLFVSSFLWLKLDHKVKLLGII